MPEQVIKIEKHSIAITEGLEKFDPRRIVRLSSANRKQIEVMVIDAGKLIPLSKKVTLSIPEMESCKGVTDIRSVQILSMAGKKMIIAEIAGPADLQVYMWIQAVAKAMMKYNVISAFFPAYASKEPSSFCYGAMGDAGSFESIFDGAIQNLRVLEDGENLILTTGKDIRTIHVSNVKESHWEKFSKVLYSGSKEILFIGRFQNKKVHITFKDNEICIFKLGPHNLQKMDNVSSSSTVSAFLGLIEKGVNAAIGMKKGSGESVLTLIPQPVMPTAA